MAALVQQEPSMQNTLSADWDFPEFEFDALPQKKPNLDQWRWSFASLPNARMKAVAAGWMVRVLLGGDPAEMSEEESDVLAVGALPVAQWMSPEDLRSWCDA
jgi:hypothetical protein